MTLSISTIRTMEFSLTETSRIPFLRHHKHRTRVKYLFIKSDETCLLDDCVALTIDTFNADNVEMLALSGLFTLGTSETTNHSAAMPVTMILLKSNKKVNVMVLKENEECVTLLMWHCERT